VTAAVAPVPVTAPRSPVLALRDIGVRYGPVTAVEGVDLDLHPGEVLALCGDNGAGKSSLIKVVSGAQRPTGGEIRLRGEVVHFGGPLDALAKGVATIYQDLALAPRLAIYQNVFMGAELTRDYAFGAIRILDKQRMIDAARGYLGRLAVVIDDMRRPVERLSGGQRQAVAIARALRWEAGIIVMDEPTAALGVRETAQVLDLVRRLRDEGRAVILISHSMQEVVEVATRVVVLRHGRKIADRPLAGLTADDLGRIITTGEDRLH
jgi:ABC-type sugar transport system ATPase subunit